LFMFVKTGSGRRSYEPERNGGGFVSFKSICLQTIMAVANLAGLLSDMGNHTAAQVPRKRCSFHVKTYTKMIVHFTKTGSGQA
jgi:hypothetical protein